MNKTKCRLLMSMPFRSSFLISLIGLPLCQAATVWTGPSIHFTQFVNGSADTIVAGKVVLTRGSNQVLYNTAAGETFAGNDSPADTKWAFGNLTDFSTLTYQSLESMRTGDLAALILNKPMVMHLINEDIFLSVEFTAWGQNGAGGFSYIRSTAAVSATPTVSITSPSAGATFSAPASVSLTASAAVSNDTVTNVAYFAGTNALGQSKVSPFNVVGTIPAPGSYDLIAVATASGISATSSVVSITVVSPTPISLSTAAVTNELFSFSHNTDSGFNYVVQASSNLLDWVPVQTNAGSGSPVLFSDGLTNGPSRFYRVGRVQSP
jgi:hypothetical protein